MVKLLTRLIIVCLCLVTALTGCESAQMAQKSNDNGNPPTNANQSPNTTAILSSMNLNTQVFKNQGDLAFVWQGLLYVLNGKTGHMMANGLRIFSLTVPLIIMEKLGLFGGMDRMLIKLKDKAFLGHLPLMF